MTEQVEYNQMQFVIKPYDMLTIIFYDAHSRNHITLITICFLRCRENLYDMLTPIYLDANNDNHILLRSQDNLRDMLTLIFYDAHSHNHITITICLLRCQEIYMTC